MVTKSDAKAHADAKKLDRMLRARESAGRAAMKARERAKLLDSVRSPNHRGGK